MLTQRKLALQQALITYQREALTLLVLQRGDRSAPFSHVIVSPLTVPQETLPAPLPIHQALHSLQMLISSMGTHSEQGRVVLPLTRLLSLPSLPTTEKIICEASLLYVKLYCFLFLFSLLDFKFLEFLFSS